MDHAIFVGGLQSEGRLPGKLASVGKGDRRLLPGIGKGIGKGDRHLLCEAPIGPFRQKVPVPFSDLPKTADDLAEVQPLDELHDQDEPALDLAGVVGANDMRMIEPPDGLHFPLESNDGPWVIGSRSR